MRHHARPRSQTLKKAVGLGVLALALVPANGAARALAPVTGADHKAAIAAPAGPLGLQPTQRSAEDPVGMVLPGGIESEVEGDPGTDDLFGYAIAVGDFNGDTYEDTAIGVPFEDVDGARDAGAVNVIYGFKGGLSATEVPDQLWHQNVDGVEDAAKDGDSFGFALAVGDFDGDGYDDLAVGVQHETVGRVVGAGAVNVIHGSKEGLSTSAAPARIWHQDVPGLGDAGGAEEGDVFGSALAVGRFNDDGYDDLAIGVRLEDVGEIRDAGAAHVLYGTDAGLSATDVPGQARVRRYWHQNVSGVPGAGNNDEWFGSSLASGDFDGDGIDDLAVGIWEDTLAVGQVGGVNVIHGARGGLRPRGTASEYFNQDTPGVEDDAETGELFGYQLAAGNFDADGYDDLAVGVPSERVAGGIDSGAVNVIHGAAGGLSATATPDQLWHQGVTDVEGEPGSQEFFGVGLAVGRFDGDAYDDLAIGSPGDLVGDASGAGSVNVIHGSRHGLNATHVPDQLWSQAADDVDDDAEYADAFGWALAAGRFNGDGFDDLAIGSLQEDVGSVADAGAVNVIHGAASGLSATVVPDQFWHQGS